MLYYKDTPEGYTEEFDDLSIRQLAMLAEKYATVEEAKLEDVIFNEPGLPDCIKEYDSRANPVAGELFEVMLACIRYGANEQRRHAQKHFNKMFSSYYKEGLE